MRKKDPRRPLNETSEGTDDFGSQCGFRCPGGLLSGEVIEAHQASGLRTCSTGGGTSRCMRR